MSAHGKGRPASRPSEKSAAAKPLASGVDSTASDDVSGRSEWARQLIAAGGPNPPEYGSPAWDSLPGDSRVRVAACVVAAEKWRTRRKGVRTVDPLGYSLSAYPSLRRRIAEARAPRPGDYPGGPVPMWGPDE